MTSQLLLTEIETLLLQNIIKAESQQFFPKLPVTKFLKIKYSTNSVPSSLAYVRVLFLESCHSLTVLHTYLQLGRTYFIPASVSCQVTKLERMHKGNEATLRRLKETNSERGRHTVSIPPLSLHHAPLTKPYHGLIQLFNDSMPALRQLNVVRKTHNHIVCFLN